MFDFADGASLESFLAYWCLHIGYAPYLLFGLLLLTGFNVPVGEEPLLIFGGVLTAHCGQEALFVWAWLYAGTILAAYITYWIGRFFGPQVASFPFVSRLVDPPTIEKIGHRIERYGVFTFLLGRFLPGGMRNTLFFTSGWTKMPFLIFVFRDGLGALASTSFFFLLGMQLSEHAVLLFHDIAIAKHWLEMAFLLVIASCLSAWAWHRFIRK